MKTVRDVPLHQVPIVTPETTLDVVDDLLKAEPLQIVVLVSDEQYMGIFTADALASSLIPEGVALSDLIVGPYVHPSRVIAHPANDIFEVITLMKRKGQSVAPVVDNRTYKGVVTQGDLEAAQV